MTLPMGLLELHILEAIPVDILEVISQPGPFENLVNPSFRFICPGRNVLSFTNQAFLTNICNTTRLGALLIFAFKQDETLPLSILHSQTSLALLHP
jgi:hypothetical protein